MQEYLSFSPKTLSVFLFRKEAAFPALPEPEYYPLVAAEFYGDGLLADASEQPPWMKKPTGKLYPDPLAFFFFGGNGIMNYSMYKSLLEQAKPSLEKEEEIAVVPEEPPAEEEKKFSRINPFLFFGGSGALNYSTFKWLLDKDPLVQYKSSVGELLTKKEKTDEKNSPCSYPLPKRIDLTHIEGWEAGINYGTNYSSLAILFAPDYRIGHTLPLVDLRAHRFDNNTYAASLGVIARYLPESFCELLGANIYYDYRQGSIGHFHQMGVGVEILSKRWDFRANAYIPFTTEFKCQCHFDDYQGGFFIKERKTETVSYGYNAEVGYLAVRTHTFLLYLAAGPYYMTGRHCHEKTRGVKARIRPQYKDYLALDLSMTHDPVYETVYQAKVIISLPLYQITGQNKNHCGVTDRQIYQPVERFEVMPVGKCQCWKTNF